MSVSAAQQITDWLEKLALGQYAQCFAENEIDLSILGDLTDQDLEKIGVAPLGHRRKLLRAIAELSSVEKGTPVVTAEGAAPVAPQPRDTAERRQVTVMFSDLVGSTALSARMDPEDLREIISAYQKCVAVTVQRFGGFVAKYMGDGVLVYFGYPQAHEYDAERAVRAGLELIAAVSALKAPASLQTRVGIATGLVVVGDLIGSGDAQERGIVGETPNLAARLQGIAEPNMVVIAEDTRRLLGNLFELEDLGPKDLKGIAGPAHAWAALRPASVESRFDALHASGLTELVGREEELETLLRCWSRAKAGEGQVVLLSGEAGIGKSRLTAALLERLAGEPHTRLRYFCSPQHTDSVLYPVIGQMERAAALGHDDSVQVKLDKLDAVLAQTSTDEQDAALFAEMLSLPNDGRYPAIELTPEQRRKRTLEALISQLETLTQRSPVLMVLEDAHWADPTSLEVFGRIIDRVRSIRVLLIVTFRPEFQAPWIGRPYVTALTINRLAERDIDAMIDRVVGNKLLPDHIRQDIIDRTDGIPLFVEEMTKAVIEAGSEDAARRIAAGIPSPTLTVPATLQASLMARLDRLGSAKDVAQIGAAIGREFSHALFSAVVSKPEPELESALDRLIAAGLLFRQGVPPHASYLFKHALVQDAAYSTLLRRRRQQLHSLIANTLESRFPEVITAQPEVVAQHYAEAGLIEKSVQYWLSAGQLALGRTALPEAIAHLDRGLTLVHQLSPSPQRDRLELQIRNALGTAWWARKGWMAEEMVEVLKPALDLAKALQEPAETIQVLWGLWVYYLIRGRLPVSLSWAEQVLSVAEEAADRDLILIGQMPLMITHFWLGEVKEAARHGDAILSQYDDQRHWFIADKFNHDPKTISGIYAQHWLWMLGYPDQALELARRKDEHARHRNHPFDLGFALTQGAHVYDYISDVETLRAHGEEAERIGLERGLATFEIMGQSIQGVALVRAGRYEVAVPALRAAIERWHSTGASLWARYIRAVLAEALARSGHFAEGLEICDGVLGEIEQPDCSERVHYAEILRLRGFILLLLGDCAGAERNYSASLRWARQQETKSWELRAAMSMARLWRDQVKRDEARELLAPVYGWFTEGFDTRDLKEAKALLEELAA